MSDHLMIGRNNHAGKDEQGAHKIWMYDKATDGALYKSRRQVLCTDQYI